MWDIGWKASFVALAGLTATLACDSATEPETELPDTGEVNLQVSDDRFVWSKGEGGFVVAIPYVYENPFDEVLTFVSCRCGALYGLERWNGQSWDRVDTGYFRPMCLCLQPEQVQPRETRVRTAIVGALPAHDDLGLSEDRLSGIFRLVLVSLYFDWDSDSGNWGE